MKKQANPQTGPKPSRPRIPALYGIPKDKKGLLPWSHVAERMAKAMHYWVSTTSPDRHPHATPVDGVWLEDALYFGGSEETRRSRNLAANPAVCIHLESGSDVIIMHGEAIALGKPERTLAVRLSEASVAKYGYGPSPEDYGSMPGSYIFRPSVVMAWSQFPKDATRWEF